MFKLSSAINVVVGTVLVVPALTLQGPRPASLEQALDQTVQALESLAGLEHRLATKDANALPQVLAWTEPALPSTEERDERLDTLRLEVERLQSEFDALTPISATFTAPISSPGAAMSSDDEPTTPKPPTVGLDDGMRKWLSGMPAASAPAEPRTREPAAASSAPERASFEPDGYAADPLRLGRAYFRQGNYLQGLAVLEPMAADPDAGYWRARCLEKLGRTSEAVAAYEKVCADPAAGDIAQRAKDDLDFLNWRAAFQKRMQDEARGSSR